MKQLYTNIVLHARQEMQQIDLHINNRKYMLFWEKNTEYKNQPPVEWHYFPKGFGDVMETYSWSDNIKQAVIKNQKGYSLIFNHEEIAPGETKVFTPVTHKQGLFSPDCYNGKSLFTMGEEDAEKEDWERRVW